MAGQQEKTAKNTTLHQTESHLFNQSRNRVSYLVEICRNAGVLPAEVRAVGAGALSQGPAGGEAATLLTVADRGSLSGGDLT